PGYRLVRQVQDLGYAVRPIPGACAAIAALSASGLPTDRFLFEGFLPAKAGARAARLQALAAQSATLVFYEAPHRVAETLEAMVACFGGEREALLARELTKTFETLHRAPLAGLSRFVADDSNQQRGEIVLAVAGQRGRDETVTPEVAQLLRRLAQELPAKRAAAVVADCTGLRKKLLYEYLVHSQPE
ncbi:MAG TPA: SAM-dependent methyltransferase, partial [Kineobactrum sp.]